MDENTSVNEILDRIGVGDNQDEMGAPDPYDASSYDNKKKVSELIDKFMKTDDTARSAFEWGAFRNLCLVAGAHGIVRIDGNIRVRSIPKYYPRTQTNKFREKRNDLISAVAQGRVPIKHLPATDDDESHATAEIGERVRDVTYAEATLDEKENEIAGWFIDTGNVFLLPEYDYDEKFGMVETPKLECPQCGAKYGSEDQDEIDGESPHCRECGVAEEDGGNGLPPSPLVQSSETELLPIGALQVNVLSQFDVRGDYRIPSSKWSWFIYIKRYEVAFAKERFGYEGGGDESREPNTSLSQHYLDVIAGLSDQFNPQGGLGTTGSGSHKVPKVTAYKLFMLPNEDFPEGLCGLRIGRDSKDVVHIDPLDSEYGVGIREGQKFLPIVHGKAVGMSGRTLGASPLDDAVPLQHFRNRVERAIDLEIRRMANGAWLNPKGSGVENISGEAGQFITYNPFAVGGTTIAKPERITPQLQYIQYLIEMLKQIDDAIERVTGTYFLAGGDAPNGVSAASALSLLDSRAKRAIGPMKREWAKMYLELDKMMLELARKHWTDERIQVAAGKNKEWEVATFMNSDLQGAITMEIDYESLFPSSEATERAEIEQLIQGGIINPTDPEQKLEVLRKFGKMSMLGSEDVHTRRAKIEQSEFLKTGAAPQLLPMIHNSMIHIREHVKFGNTDEFMALPPEQKDLWTQHIQAHFIDEGARRALLSELQVNPDVPGATDLTLGGAEAAAQGAQSVAGQIGQTAGTTAGNQVGSRAPKGTTGAGPNQAKAAEARSKQVLTQPPLEPQDIAGAIEPQGAGG